MAFDLSTAKPVEEGGFDLSTAQPVGQGQSATNTRIAQEAVYKGVAAIPDTLLNTPNTVLNLGRAAFGAGATALGRPDLAPELKPNPNFARRGLESAGLIDPNIQPEGFAQKAIDLLVQGGVGGALTGGASLPRVATGAGMGLLSSGAAGSTQALGGSPAMVAAAGLLAPAGAGRLVSGGGKLQPNQQLLADENVLMTPGQIKGGAVKRMEDAATSVPVVGDAIRAAQRRSVESFANAAINRGLAPIKEKLPSGLKGNEAIAYAYGKLGDAYEGLLPNLKGDLNAGQRPNVPAVPGQPVPRGSFKQDLDNIKAMGQNLPDAQRTQLNAIIDKEVIGQFTPQGLASGETLKNIESLLGKLAIKKAQSDNYHENQLGGALKEIQDSMRTMINTVNPNYATELGKINWGYSNFKRAQTAAASVGAQDGVFSPAQLHRAVKAGDKSKDKARFAEGTANMQDLSTAGKAVLPSSVPDSGTPYRAALMYALSHPLQASLLGVPMGAATLPYTQFGQRGLQSLLTQGNPMYSEVANRSGPIVTGTTLSDLLK